MSILSALRTGHCLGRRALSSILFRSRVDTHGLFEKAIALLQRIKHLSIDVDGEARKHKSQRLVELSHEIDVDCTDAINALFGVKL
ncbi:MAG: hypothetical protein ABIT71_11200 [Vicinamibacteraceae bacterium]